MILTYIIDIDETLKLNKRSRSQGQRSKSYRYLCEEIVWTITHERIDGY